MSPDPRNYASINASRKHHHSTKPHLHKRGFSRPNRLEALRLAIFTLVLATSLIALALAAHFLTVLQANDLTHFVPFALFTSVASMIGMLALMGVVLVHKSKPIALKIELGIMAVIGIFWLSLSIFVSTSPAESAEVQCFSDDGELLADDDDPFDTSEFHAQYRVLTAIGSLNAFILLLVCAVLTFMALRHFNRTRDWVTTTRKPLLGEKSRSKSRERSRSKSHRPMPTLTDLPKRVARRAIGLAGVGVETYANTKDNNTRTDTNTKTMKEKEKAGLSLPAVARGTTTTRPTNTTAAKNTKTNSPGTRPPPPTPVGRAQTPAIPTPVREPTRPQISKSKSLPNPSKVPVRDRPTTSTANAKNPTLTPPPKARMTMATGGGNGNGAGVSGGGKGSPKPVVRRKTNGA